MRLPHDSGAPPAAEAPQVEEASSDQGGTTPAPGLGAWVGLAVAAVASFGLGWLGYHLVQSLGPPGAAVPEAVSDAAAGGAPAAKLGQAGGSAPFPRFDQAISDAPGWRQTPTSGTASLQCHSGGQAEREALADPSNYGPRLAQDWQGRPVPHTPMLIVLHETVVDENAALELFRRRHSDDAQQASYHVLIGRDGRRIRVVPDVQRAYGAGDSAWNNVAVQLRPAVKPSVNNIALHVSLVSPSDGVDGEGRSHSGYTPAQYLSLAKQIAFWQASYGIPASRVVTHQEVDRSGTRRDPRSLDWTLLGRNLQASLLACGATPQMADLGRGLLPR